MAEGGLRECLARGLLYVGMARGDADERGFAAIRRLRLRSDLLPPLSLAEFKALLREQYFILLIDPAGALEAIPSLLPSDTEVRRRALEALEEVLTTRGALSGEPLLRWQRLVKLFGGPAPAAKPVGDAGKEKPPAKAGTRAAG